MSIWYFQSSIVTTKLVSAQTKFETYLRKKKCFAFHSTDKATQLPNSLLHGIKSLDILL